MNFLDICNRKNYLRAGSRGHYVKGSRRFSLQLLQLHISVHRSTKHSPQQSSGDNETFFGSVFCQQFQIFLCKRRVATIVAKQRPMATIALRGLFLRFGSFFNVEEQQLSGKETRNEKWCFNYEQLF